MSKIDPYKIGFNDPDNPRSLYSRSKKSLVEDVSIEEKKREREVCEFWTKTEREKKFEEVSDFSIAQSDTYRREVPKAEEFTDNEYRIVNSMSDSQCSSCDGTGNYCSECNGTGTKSCSCIDGYQRNTCSNCNGSGTVEVLDTNLDERNIDCGDCEGNGKQKSIHSKCSGRGKLDCKTCLNGNRDVECEICDGTGDVTLIDATVIKYSTQQNESEYAPPSLENADHNYISDPIELQWTTVNEKVFDHIPKSEESKQKPSDELLSPVPNKETVKIRYSVEEIKYKKIDFVLKTSALAGEYDEKTVEKVVWKQDDRGVIDKISVSKNSIVSYPLSLLYDFLVVGLWGGSIITLLLMLPIVAIDDYIFGIPDSILGAIAFVIFLILNVIILEDSIVGRRYKFSI